jgi:5'-nucleotidase
MTKTNENLIALVDMDGTVADYDGQMVRDLEKLRAPCEPKINLQNFRDKEPLYILERMKLIKANGDWWENLPRLPIGFEIVKVLRRYGFQINICTQGPKKNAVAWSHKLSWILKNMPYAVPHVVRNKGLMYGRILVDDFPEYIEQWLAFRPRGLVIMPAHDYNKDFSHPNVLRYDGTDPNALAMAIRAARDRKSF